MDKLINTILVILTFLCLYAITHIGLGWFWHWGTCSNYQQVNLVLVNLSYSYLAGFVFYLLTSYFPYMLKCHKLKRPIVEKLKTINGKLVDSAKCVFPMASWNYLALTEDELIRQFSQVSINDPSAYSIAGINMNILSHLLTQRDNIIDVINGVLEYKEYLTVEQLLNLERIKDGEYFSLLKVFSIPIMDNSKTREQLAKALFQEIEVSKRLVKSISV